jgi:hypothetical protein
MTAPVTEEVFQGHREVEGRTANLSGDGVDESGWQQGYVMAAL